MKSIYDDEYRRIIKKLIEYRKIKKVTQVELAAMLKVPQQFVSKVETFVRRLDLAETIKICEILKIDIVELIAK